MNEGWELKGKRALVTGASRGIGRAVALQLAEHGALVAATYHRDHATATNLRTELAELAEEHIVVQADVTDAGAARRAVALATERFDRIDILVNNAGVISHRTLEQLAPSEWRRIVDTNLTGTYLVTRETVNHMGEGGSIVNVTSAVATRGMPAAAHYTASKAGLIGLTRALCKELGPRGIRVNAVAPGIIDTDQAAGLSGPARAKYEAMTSLQRLGTSDEVANAIVFLASDVSSYVTGQTLVVDGGI
jgi:NAD(P)-dependent dehydrogenase (short-subunit alcohol dehydrogenase family)